MRPFADYLDVLRIVFGLLIDRWNHLPSSTRIFLALTIALGLLYIGSKMEEAGWSTVMMLASFCFFAYLLMLSIALVH